MRGNLSANCEIAELVPNEVRNLAPGLLRLSLAMTTFIAGFGIFVIRMIPDKPE